MTFLCSPAAVSYKRYSHPSGSPTSDSFSSLDVPDINPTPSARSSTMFPCPSWQPTDTSISLFPFLILADNVYYLSLWLSDTYNLGLKTFSNLHFVSLQPVLVLFLTENALVFLIQGIKKQGTPLWEIFLASLLSWRMAICSMSL